MNIKFKNLFKTLLISSLVFISCDSDDLEDSGLELSVKPFNFGGGPFKFEVDGTEDLVESLVITNKINANEGEQSLFIVTETTTLEGNIVKNKITNLFDNIEDLRKFNFDQGKVTQFKIWSLRYVEGGVDTLPTNDSFISDIKGNNFGLTKLANAIIVDLVAPIL